LKCLKLIIYNICSKKKVPNEDIGNEYKIDEFIF